MFFVLWEWGRGITYKTNFVRYEVVPDTLMSNYICSLNIFKNFTVLKEITGGFYFYFLFDDYYPRR